MSAIEATTAGFKDMADGTLRLFFDVEPRHADAALRLFRERGRAAALAALMHAHEQPAEPAPEKPKGGERAKWVAMRCQEPEFQQWLKSEFPEQARYAMGPTPETFAASIVRAVCGVESRAELDTDKYAPSRFEVLIRKRWAAHNGVTA